MGTIDGDGWDKPRDKNGELLLVDNIVHVSDLPGHFEIIAIDKTGDGFAVKVWPDINESCNPRALVFIRDR